MLSACLRSSEAKAVLFQGPFQRFSNLWTSDLPAALQVWKLSCSCLCADCSCQLSLCTARPGRLCLHLCRSHREACWTAWSWVRLY